MNVVSLPVPSRVRRPLQPADTWGTHLRIVHVGQSALLLEDATESAGSRSGSGFVVITAADRGVVPAGVCLPDARDFAAVRQALVSAMRAGDVSADLSGWKSVPVDRVDLRVAPVDVDPRALGSFGALCAERSAWPGTGPTGSGPMDPARQRLLAPLLADAALDDDVLEVAGLLNLLVGAGPGATPAGDDVIVGTLAGLAAVAGTVLPTAEAQRAAGAIAEPLSDLVHRTTAASRHDLAAACDGQFAERVQVLTGGLADQDLVPAAWAMALRWGASSGIDLTAGLVATVTSACRRSQAISPGALWEHGADLLAPSAVRSLETVGA